MTMKQAQNAAKRFAKRTGFLVDWVEMRNAIKTNNIIIRNGIAYQAIKKIKL